MVNKKCVPGPSCHSAYPPLLHRHIRKFEKVVPSFLTNNPFKKFLGLASYPYTSYESRPKKKILPFETYPNHLLGSSDLLENIVGGLTRGEKLQETGKKLQTALEKKELHLVYQPIVRLEDDKISRFEALLRWDKGHIGGILPEEFIKLAEESGLIIPLGEFALQQACEQLSKWWSSSLTLENYIGINVNLSVTQLCDPSAIQNLLEIIQKYSFPPQTLKLEITESSLAENIDYCISQLKKFKAYDVKLCIDDFGTGFSSLSYLCTFPLDSIKIDASFIRRISSDPKAYRIVKAIVNLAHDLNYEVVAEGVETPEQLLLVRQLNCDYAQGFYFSPPVSPEVAEKILSQGFSQ